MRISVWISDVCSADLHDGGSFDQRRAGPAGLHTVYFRGGVVEAARTRGFRRNGDVDAGRRVCADVQRSGTLASNRDGPCTHTSPDEHVLLGEYDPWWRAGADGEVQVAFRGDGRGVWGGKRGG